MLTPEPSTIHQHATLILDAICDLGAALTGGYEAAQTLVYNVAPMRDSFVTNDPCSAALEATLRAQAHIAAAQRWHAGAVAALAPFIDANTNGADGF